MDTLTRPDRPAAYRGAGAGDSPALTRRGFLGSLSSLCAAAALPALAGPPSRRARVVLVRDPGALSASGEPEPRVIGDMIDTGLRELLDVKDPLEGLAGLLGPGPGVGIKTNEWSPLSTPRAVEQALLRRIERAVKSTSEVPMSDRAARRLLTGCRALVNVRPLRTHHWSGIGGCIKNPIMFAADPSFYHPDLCADLARLWELPALSGKVKLNLLVVLTPQFYTRGPHHFDRRYVWSYGGILLSTDPVAADAIGVRILEAKRRAWFGEDRPLTELAKHVRLADERHGLGVADGARIDLVRVGPRDGALL